MIVTKSIRSFSYKSLSMYRYKLVDVNSSLTLNSEELLHESIKNKLDSRLQFMNQNKIDCSIVRCSYDAPVDVATCRLTNEQLSQVCVSSQGRLFGLATLPSSDPTQTAIEMEKWSKLGGIRGFVLNCEGIARKVDGYKENYQFFKIASDLEMPIVLKVQSGTANMECDFLLMKSICNIISDGIFDFYPTLKIVITGNGFILPYLMSQLDKVNPSQSLQKEPIERYVKSNIFFTTNQIKGDFVQYLLNVTGNDNVLFGASDESSSFDVEEYTLAQSQLTKQKICGLNAANVFNLDAYRPIKLDMDKIKVVKSTAVALLSSKLRDKNTDYKDYMIYGDRLMTILAEEALAAVPSVVREIIETPTGTFNGLVDEGSELCVVSIVRSGDILLESVRKLVPGIRVGKILIQRDETTEDKRPILFYDKLPSDISKCFVLLVDPMVATAGSMLCATDVLLKKGVSVDNMMFVNLFSCEEGLANIQNKYPNLKIITLAIDDYLNSDKYIVPGVGDFGDRYYGTNH